MKVLVPSALRTYTGTTEVDATGGTLLQLFADLDQRYPGLRFRVVNEQQRLRRNMRIFVNGVAACGISVTRCSQTILWRSCWRSAGAEYGGKYCETQLVHETRVHRARPCCSAAGLRVSPATRPGTAKPFSSPAWARPSPHPIFTECWTTTRRETWFRSHSSPPAGWFWWSPLRCAFELWVIWSSSPVAHPRAHGRTARQAWDL